MTAETAVDEQRKQIASRLGEPEAFAFPAEWSTSSSWHRAQAADSTIGAVNPAEFDVLLGRLEGDALMSRHRVLFTTRESFELSATVMGTATAAGALTSPYSGGAGVTWNSQ